MIWHSRNNFRVYYGNMAPPFILSLWGAGAGRWRSPCSSGPSLSLLLYLKCVLSVGNILLTPYCEWTSNDTPHLKCVLSVGNTSLTPALRVEEQWYTTSQVCSKRGKHLITTRTASGRAMTSVENTSLTPALRVEDQWYTTSQVCSKPGKHLINTRTASDRAMIHQISSVF